jgi:hypothetical protein
MDEFEYRQPQLSFSPESNLNLSIQIAREFISFAIQEKSDHKLVYLKHIPYEPLDNWGKFAGRLENIIQSLDILTNKFSSIEAIWISEKYSLVPKGFTDELYLKNLFQLVHPLENLEELKLVEVKETDYNLLFSLPNEVADILSKLFPGLQLFQEFLPMHFAYLNSLPKPNSISVYTQIYPEFADIAVYQNGSLKLANSFGMHEKTDLVYHLLNIFNHFELDPAIDSLSIVDHYFHGITGHDALKKYFQNTQFLKPNLPVENLSLFEAQDISRYVNLLNAINCV